MNNYCGHCGQRLPSEKRYAIVRLDGSFIADMMQDWEGAIRGAKHWAKVTGKCVKIVRVR